LRGRGLVIENEKLAIDYLSHIGYFRLSAYLRPLYRDPKARTHEFKEGATLDRALTLYRFDRKLRILVFNELEKIEVAIRGAMSNIVSDGYGDVFWMTKRESYNNQPYRSGSTECFNFEETLKFIISEIGKSKEEFIKHFYRTYQDEYPPAWMIAEIVPMGVLRTIFRNIGETRLQKLVAQEFDLPLNVFTSWFEVLTNLRNMCCHHTRMWNKEISIDPAYPQKRKDSFVSDGNLNKHRIYIRLAIIKYMLNKISPSNNFTDKLNELIGHYKPDLIAMGFPANWETEPVWQYHSVWEKVSL
jgi:abortive infection bacteriophage resistance protein